MRNFIGCFLLVLIVGSSSGQSTIWQGNTDSSWEEATNWSTLKVPDTATEVYVNKGFVRVRSNVSCKRLTVNPGATVMVDSGVSLLLTNIAGSTVAQVNNMERTIDSIEMFPGSRPFLLTDVQSLLLATHQRHR